MHDQDRVLLPCPSQNSNCQLHVWGNCIQHAVFGIQCFTFSVQYLTSRIMYVVFSSYCLVVSIGQLVCSIQQLVFIQYLVCIVQCIVENVSCVSMYNLFQNLTFGFKFAFQVVTQHLVCRFSCLEFGMCVVGVEGLLFSIYYLVFSVSCPSLST